ncbi:MAG TPA: MFS transporter [Trueperaceae bacterium]
MSALDKLQNGVRQTYFGWWIVAGGIGLQILGAGLVMQAYGTYVAVWKEEFGWTATVFALAFALQRGFMALLSPVQGRLLQRFGPRLVIRAGLVVLAIGFVMLSRFETQAGFYLAFLVMALGVALSGFLSLTVTVVNWFERRRSSALALMQIGISVGGLLVPIVAWLLTDFGWRFTALLSAGLVLALGLPLSAVMRGSPEELGVPMEGVGAPAAREGADRGDRDSIISRDFRTREALRTRAFWLITAGHATAVTLVAAVTVHIVIHLNEGLGYSIQTAATIIALMTGVTMLGQLLGGFLGDRFSKRVVAALAMLGHAVALLSVAFASNLAMVLFFAVLHGLCWGVRGPIMQALRADYFGRASFATIMGISFSFVMIGQMLGPLLAGILADATGGYRLAFMLLALLVGSSSLFFVFAVPPRKPERPRD